MEETGKKAETKSKKLAKTKKKSKPSVKERIVAFWKCKGRVSQDHLAKQRIIKESDNCSAGCFCCTQRVYQVL